MDGTPVTPTSLKVLGILGIIYAAFCLLTSVCGLIQSFFPFTHDAMNDELRKDGIYVGYTLGTQALQFFLSVLLLVSSIGCLKVKPWARMGMNAYAVATILLSIGGTIFTLIYLLPKMTAALAAPGGAMSPAAFNTMMIAILVVSLGIVGAIVTTILILANRKIAVDAFNGIFPADPTNFPMDYPPPPGG